MIGGETKHCTALFDESVSDAHYRHLVNTRAIVPRKSRTRPNPFTVVLDACGSGRANPEVIRRLRAVVGAAGATRDQKKMPCFQLLYDLAIWHLGRGRHADIPARALKAHMDDRLWGILQRHGEVPFDACGLNDLTAAEKSRLEKRLHQKWPTVKRVADAISAPTLHASRFRHKPSKSFVGVLLQASRATRT